MSRAAISASCCPSPLDVDRAVRDRYSAAARNADATLCCPVSYDQRHLEAIPPEVLEKDYGCGDPSRWLQPGETVLDLGSGGGKVCYIAAQVVGPTGRVIGIDCNDEMLALANQYRGVVAERLGYANVEFRRGRIQDLGLDLDVLAEHLRDHPVRSLADWLDLREFEAEQRRSRPLVAPGSVDVVISNCVLNLVRPDDRRQLFHDVYRVLRPGGRAVISDIVASADVPAHLQQDARLWSGCISGAFRQDRFVDAFAEAGFRAPEVVARQEEPWAVVEEIEFRSVTVRAVKPTADQAGDEFAAAGQRLTMIEVDGRGGCDATGPNAGRCCS
jgi:SAM-dependent methyltransferase